jgi:P-type Ca2+ transporter type 2C
MRKASRAPTTINLGGYRSEAGMTMAVSQQVRGNEDARSGWHASEVSAVARELGVEPEQGLSVEEARSRLGSHTALSLSHLAVGFLARDQHSTIFNRAALPGPTQLRRYGIALLAIIAATSLDVLQPIFGTVELSFAQWSICIGIAASLLVVEELIKLVLRRRERRHLTPEPEPALSRA